MRTNRSPGVLSWQQKIDLHHHFKLQESELCKIYLHILEKWTGVTVICNPDREAETWTAEGKVLDRPAGIGKFWIQLVIVLQYIKRREMEEDP